MIFCFFKQKTAYEMLRSLVGSEMCIRDRIIPEAGPACFYAVKRGLAIEQYAQVAIKIIANPDQCAPVRDAAMARLKGVKRSPARSARSRSPRAGGASLVYSRVMSWVAR